MLSSWALIQTEKCLDASFYDKTSHGEKHLVDQNQRFFLVQKEGKNRGQCVGNCQVFDMFAVRECCCKHRFFFFFFFSFLELSDFAQENERTIHP